MRPDPAARDARDANRSTALRALQERDQARRERDVARKDATRSEKERDAAREAATESDRLADVYRRRAEKANDRIGSLAGLVERLTRVDALHYPDETGKACKTCGATFPCKTRRELDR